MVAQYIQALAALRKIKPMLNPALYDALITAVAERDDVLGARGAVQAVASGLSSMPGASSSQFWEEPRAALRFIFLDGTERSAYVLEKPEGYFDPRPVAYLEQPKWGADMTLKRASMQELIDAGAHLDLMFDPLSFPEELRSIAESA